MHGWLPWACHIIWIPSRQKRGQLSISPGGQRSTCPSPPGSAEGSCAKAGRAGPEQVRALICNPHTTAKWQACRTWDRVSMQAGLTSTQRVADAAVRFYSYAPSSPFEKPTDIPLPQQLCLSGCLTRLSWAGNVHDLQFAAEGFLALIWRQHMQTVLTAEPELCSGAPVACNLSSSNKTHWPAQEAMAISLGLWRQHGETHR